MDKGRTDRTPCKCFRCGYEYHLIAKFPKPPKDNKKGINQVRFSKRGNCASQKESENGDDDNDQNIYAYMAHMSDNDESSR